MPYERDGGGALRCLVCGGEGIGFHEQSIRGHERSINHKKLLDKLAVSMDNTPGKMPEPVLYPKAVWIPLLGHSATGTIAQRNLVVLHITAGSTAEGAIETFKASVKPNRVSAHFVVERDGTVIQLLSISDTAWHASQANSRSIGVEHVAIPEKLMATEAQYEASAELVSWLCGQMGIPIDREHVQGHHEASAVDGHVLCCEGALSADRVVEMALSKSGQQKEIPT